MFEEQFEKARPNGGPLMVSSRQRSSSSLLSYPYAVCLVVIERSVNAVSNCSIRTDYRSITLYYLGNPSFLPSSVQKNRSSFPPTREHPAPAQRRVVFRRADADHREHRVTAVQTRRQRVRRFVAIAYSTPASGVLIPGAFQRMPPASGSEQLTSEFVPARRRHITTARSAESMCSSGLQRCRSCAAFESVPTPVRPTRWPYRRLPTQSLRRPPTQAYRSGPSARRRETRA